MSSKRVVLRVHERWLDDYHKIASDWLISHEYAIANHDIRIGFIGGGRFHVIIDIEESMALEPVNLLEIPMEIYRVRRGHDGKQMIFEYIDEKEQPYVYSAARGFSHDFAWGCYK